MNRRDFLGVSFGGLAIAKAQSRMAGSRSFSSDQIKQLPGRAVEGVEPLRADWLVTPFTQHTAVYRNSRSDDIEMTNGLIRRSWRLLPNCATVSYDNLMTGASILRAIKPEAYVKLNWQEEVSIGGLLGQANGAYLKAEWIDQMTADPKAFHCTGFEIGDTRERFPWKRTRFSGHQAWPPPGGSVTFRYVANGPALQDVTILIHYEMYDGIPLLSKWLSIQNGTQKRVRLNAFVNEVLAVVEYGSSVNSKGAHHPELDFTPEYQPGGYPEHWHYPNLFVESDYEFDGGTEPGSSNQTVHWLPDPEYATQVNYELQTPCLLKVHTPLGPDVDILPGEVFVSYRTYELIYDSTDRERNGLALRRMYRTISPWITENPIMMHVTSSKAEVIKSAVDQAAEVGFEMVIISFGSGFNMEDDAPEYLQEFKELTDYARQKGIVLGGYDLLASRNISPEADVINPATGTTTGARFGTSPCLESQWGIEYFRKMRAWFEKTGMGVLEHDGSYPGDVCASTEHPGHHGLLDSQWTQWKQITEFYRWCRGRGIYLNVPDWYFLSGSSKTGMGYRETDWSLPREQQVIIARQNIFDGTWQKTPSMGWMHVPLVQYHGGGAAATIEPLHEHLKVYGQIMAQLFGSGVQAAYRGYQLYDTQETKNIVKQWVDFYKAHRAILESDIIHVRRADDRDFDAILHVNPHLEEKGFAMVYNPLDVATTRTLTLPLYYAGLNHAASVEERQGTPRVYLLNRKCEIQVTLTIPAQGLTWLVIREHF